MSNENELGTETTLSDELGGSQLPLEQGLGRDDVDSPSAPVQHRGPGMELPPPQGRQWEPLRRDPNLWFGLL